MNGIEALRAIRRIQPKLPVIMMTAYRSDEAAATATELGAFAFVLKPFDISTMLNLIQESFPPS
jgi:DNA-binding NtrC family response regulator